MTAKSILFSRFTGWHMLAVMLMFFGTIIGVNFFMARSAIMSWTGLVVKNSYVASQEFNTKSNNAQAQQDLGLTDTLRYADGLLLFSLVQENGDAVELTNLKIEVGRPSNLGQDAMLEMARALDGSYFATYPLDKGDWLAKVTGDLAGYGPWKMEHRLSLK